MNDIKVIHFNRTGGVAGTSLSVTVTAGSLDREETEMLDSLLYNTGRLSDNVRDKEKGLMADTFEYRITIETISGGEEFVFYESDIPGEAWPLIRHLTQMALSR